jgi:hypothetical protein
VWGKGLSYIDTNTPLDLQQPQELEVVYPEIQKSFIESEAGRMELTRMLIKISHEDSVYTKSEVSRLPVGEFKIRVENERIRLGRMVTTRMRVGEMMTCTSTPSHTP